MAKHGMQIEVITPQWVMLYCKTLCAFAHLVGMRPSYTHMQAVIRRHIKVRAIPSNRLSA